MRLNPRDRLVACIVRMSSGDRSLRNSNTRGYMCSMADWTLPTHGAEMKCIKQLTKMNQKLTSQSCIPVTVMLPVEKIFRVALGSLRRYVTPGCNSGS